MEFDLERFIKAQNGYDGYATALKEIKNGHKTSHWIWYIFPQMRGLGQSNTSYFYGIISLDEAKAYLENDILRERLIEISSALLENDGDIINIVGYIDSQKIRSCMTLFHQADPNIGIFQKVIDKFYSGIHDRNTLYLLGIRD